ncbi:hypothetical protein [Haloplanus aerogenes]|uniref:Uncharacterized protein n=1 Tax=Haloplanus aerogenes TaxID=660522 RepID=A0A3M0CZG7_9EURY|nr:hypothetical protein [Haloplanus aerogenes]AZH26681.1 hypothetical protein DU502_15430 [Haloplanus aerogenes]RMB12919.1 hypothetical protein ATH50_3075 [Haloplanus aerogenes]
MELDADRSLGTPGINQQLGINTDPTEQQWLEKRADNTQNPNGELWQHFPEGSTGIAGNPTPNKDPLEVFKLNFNWP